MQSQEQANLETLMGEPEISRVGYEVYNHNGDYLLTLSNRELDFVQSHRCTSDCRRIGCEFVEQQKAKA